MKKDGTIDEHAIIMYNVCQDSAIYYGKKYGQKSLLFINNRGDDIIYQYIENPGTKEQTIKEKIGIINPTDEDSFADIYRNLQLPFIDDNIVDEHYDIIDAFLKEKGIDEEKIQRLMEVISSGLYCGHAQYDNSGMLYGGAIKIYIDNLGK